VLSCPLSQDFAPDPGLGLGRITAVLTGKSGEVFVIRQNQPLPDVSDNYTVITSRAIGIDPNFPGHLLTLSSREIIPPSDNDLWPAQQYLSQHRREWRL
jgi:hypothetical protein